MQLPVCHLLVLDKGDEHHLARSLQLHDAIASSGVVNHAYNKPRHLSVMVECQLCEGRGHHVDIVEKDGRRIVTRRPCPACNGKGSIDISHGPVTDDPALRAPITTFVPCENCGGEGGWPESCGRFDVCPCCEGTGELPSSTRDLISLDDLEAIDGDKPAEAYDVDC